MFERAPLCSLHVELPSRDGDDVCRGLNEAWNRFANRSLLFCDKDMLSSSMQPSFGSWPACVGCGVSDAWAICGHSSSKQKCMRVRISCVIALDCTVRASGTCSGSGISMPTVIDADQRSHWGPAARHGDRPTYRQVYEVTWVTRGKSMDVQMQPLRVWAIVRGSPSQSAPFQQWCLQPAPPGAESVK